MQFKKMAAMAGSALMAGLAIATPVLGATVSEVGSISELVSEDSFPTFVVGSGAASDDVASAINIAVNLASYSKTTETISTSSISETSVEGGAKIRTPGNELIPWTAIQSVKSVLTSSNLDILGDDTFQTASGGSYKYKQYLYLSGDTAETTYNKVTFEKPTGENDPVISFKATSGRNLTTYKMTFSTPVPFTGVTTTTLLQAILQGTTISIMGKDFVISDCTYGSPTAIISDITILGGKNSITVISGTDKTVTVNDKDYVVHLDGVASQASGTATYLTAVGNVNGEAFELRSGNTDTLSDGTLIAAVKVIQGKTGEADYVKLAIGADKVKLASSGTVTKGTATASELASEFSSTLASGWSWMKVTYSPDTGDVYLKSGEKIEDPFASAFDIEFTGITPALDDETGRQTIELNPSQYTMQLKYKNAAGDEETMYSIYYNTTSSAYEWIYDGVSATNADNGKIDIVFDEYQKISGVEHDYFVVSKSGFSRVLKFTSFTPASNELLFTDSNTDSPNTISSSNTSATAGTLIVDGNSFVYTIVDETAKTIRMDLNGDGTRATELYQQFSYLVPEKITAGQGGLYFYKGQDTTNTNATVHGYVYADVGFEGVRIGFTGGGAAVWTANVSTYNGNAWTAGTSLALSNDAVGLYTNQTQTTATHIDYILNCRNTTGAIPNCEVSLGKTAATLQTADGYILVEEAQQGSTTHNWVFVPVSYDTTRSTVYATTAVSDDSNYPVGGIALVGADETQGMTTYGTLVSYRTGSSIGIGTISYPDSFVYGNLYVMTPEGTVITSTTGEDGGVTADTVLPITTDIVKLDTEYSEMADIGEDVIIVGGPAVNQVAAWLLGVDFPSYGADSLIPENKALVKVVADAFTDGNTAVLVAGWTADDTDFAAQVIQRGGLEGETAGEVHISGTVVSSPTIEEISTSDDTDDTDDTDDDTDTE